MLFLLKQRNYPKQNNCANNSGKDLSENCVAETYAQPTEKVSSDESAKDTYQKIYKETEAEAFNEPACQESCKGSDENCDY